MYDYIVLELALSTYNLSVYLVIILYAYCIDSIR